MDLSATLDPKDFLRLPQPQDPEVGKTKYRFLLGCWGLMYLVSRTVIRLTVFGRCFPVCDTLR